MISEFSKVNINKYLKHLKAISRASSIPGEMQSLAAKNVYKLDAMVNTVNTEPDQRPFSPSIKTMAPGQNIPLRAPFVPAERKYIALVGQALEKAFGPCIIDYSKVEEKDYYKVDAGQSMAKISPKVTKDAPVRRYENLQQQVHRKRHFKPDTVAGNAAIRETLADFGILEASCVPDGTQLGAKGFFAAHSSNTGYPFFSNEMKEENGKSYRDIAIEYTNKALSKWGPSGIAAMPDIIIGRDQQGGWTTEVCETDPQHAAYKPSKARTVGATPRLVTGLQIPVLKSIINSERGQSEPCMCGFGSQERRLPLYDKFYLHLTSQKLVADNTDFITFDETLSEELMATAAMITKRGVKFKDVEHEDIFDATVAQLIYTKYYGFDPTSKTLKEGYANGGLPSGTGYTGLFGYIVNKLAINYAKIRMYGASYVSKMNHSFRMAGTFAHVGLGDDSLTGYKSHNDVIRMAKILHDDLGLEIATTGIKNIRGVFFLQERGMPELKTIYYPAGRVMGNALYTERKKGYGPATGDLTYMSKIFNIRTLPKEVLLSLVGILMSTSKTLLGLQTLSGEKQTPKGLISAAVQENAEHDETVKDAIGDGDPSKEVVYNDDGTIKSVIIQWYFDLLEEAKQFKGQGYPSYQNIKG